MKTEIILIRHGETEWNKEGKFQGCTNINLSEDGILQAGFLKDRLKGQFDYIYTSPLNRAVQTANIICQDIPSIKPVVMDGIREINFGQWEGLTIYQIREQYPVEYLSWRTDEDHGNLVGGDLTLRNASNRAKDAILKVANTHEGKRIAIIAHGGILKAGIIGLFDWKMTMYHRIFFGNTSVSKIIIGNSNIPILVTLNDTSHLPTSYEP